MKIQRSTRRWGLALALILSGFGGNVSAILLDRGPDMVYDTVLEITWVRDASLCVTLDNCVNRNDLFVTGGMPWVSANQWAADLQFGGFDDWRLPYASVSAGANPALSVYACTGAGGADELACRDNEMNYMFYYNLGLPSPNTGDQTAIGGEELFNIQNAYWSGTTEEATQAWLFNFINSGQFDINKIDPLAGWAVRDGDVGAAVPEPGVLLLFGIGLAGLAFSRRKRVSDGGELSTCVQSGKPRF